jgi:hypothetical protein
MDAGRLAEYLLIVVTLGAILGVILVYAKTKGATDSIPAIATANQELRQIIDDREDQIERLKEDFTKKLQLQELDCKREISQMQGKIDVLTSQLGRDIAREVVDAIRQEQKE